jgi:Uma2 family endonuclease
MRDMQTDMADLPEVEYLDGRRFPKVSPKTRHALVQSAVWEILKAAAGDRGFAGTEWRFRLAPDPNGTLFVPDVAYISVQRLASILPEQREEPTVAPEIAVEVRSPRDDLSYLQKKITRYLECGALAVLDVDPIERTIAVHTAAGVRTFKPGEFVCVEGLTWLSFRADRAFETIDRFERL